MIENKAWEEKFSPQTLSECFLPNETREALEKAIEDDNLQSSLFSGPPGIGKTTVAKAIGNDTEMETLFINSSLYGNIDTLRTDIQQFASTLSFNGKRKLIILDEADGMTAAFQAALRGVINEFSTNAVFILTANYRAKLIEPLISRFDEYNFLFKNEEKRDLAIKLFSFIKDRLDEEGVEYELKAVQKFIIDRISKSSDIRKIISQAQRISSSGVFNEDSLLNDETSRIEEVVNLVKSKNFDDIRKWVGENSDLDSSFLYRGMYDNLKHITKKEKYPILIALINEYQFKHVFVADKEINLSACLAEIAAAL